MYKIGRGLMSPNLFRETDVYLPLSLDETPLTGPRWYIFKQKYRYTEHLAANKS